MKNILSILLVSGFLFGCGGENPIESVEKIEDIEILNSYNTKRGYNLYLLYKGSLNIEGDKFRIGERVKQIHKNFKEVNVWIYTSQKGYECYENNKFDGDCLEYKDDLLLISKKSKERNLNSYKLMKENGMLGKFIGVYNEIIE